MSAAIATTTEVFTEEENGHPCYGVRWHGVRYGGRFYDRTQAYELAYRLENAPSWDHLQWCEQQGIDLEPHR